MDSKPDYAPATKMAKWLSSQDVKDIIVRVAQAGGDKATCWDLNWEINKLIEETRL